MRAFWVNFKKWIRTWRFGETSFLRVRHLSSSLLPNLPLNPNLNPTPASLNDTAEIMDYWKTLSSRTVGVVQKRARQLRLLWRILDAIDSELPTMLRRVVTRMPAVWEKWNNGETGGCYENQGLWVWD